MRILITGAHGLLGGSLLREETDAQLVGCGRRPEPVVSAPYHQVDLADPEAVLRLLRQVRPDHVIHTAALTDVDRCETDPDFAHQANVGLVAHLVAACGALGIGLVQISTDYVFDGSNGPYGEGDATAPVCNYGRQKLESERLVLGSEIEGLVVRTLWLYGHTGGARRNLVTWPVEALARGESLRIVDDQWGNPTYVRDAASCLIELCQHRATGIFHLGGASFLTRYELVRQLADLFGLDASLVSPMSTAQADQAAPRPLRSGLRYEALSGELGREPLSLSEGIGRLRSEPDFCRDFPGLA